MERAVVVITRVDLTNFKFSFCATTEALVCGELPTLRLTLQSTHGQDGHPLKLPFS